MIAAPAHTIRRYAAGQYPACLTPGDLLLVHGTDVLGRIAEWGQKRRPEYQQGDAWRWCHVACASAPMQLVEATARGVHRTPLTAYDNADTWLIHTSALPEQRADAAAFLTRQCGHPYNLLDLVQLSAWLAFRRELPLSERGAWTCAELGAEVLRRLGHPLGLPFARVLPADIALAFEVPA